MKKLFALLMCVLLIWTGTLSASAEGALSKWELPWWCMLECEDTVLTLTFPMSEADVLESAWLTFISDGTLLEMISCITLGDEPNESDEPMCMISFASVGRNRGDVYLQVTQTRGESDEVIQDFMLKLRILWDGTIQVLQAQEIEFPYEVDLYYVQAGAFAQLENAQNQLQALTQQGFDGLIKRCDDLYKVQAGAFALRSNAQIRLDALKEVGFADAYITTELKGAVLEGASAIQPPFFTYIVKENDTLWRLANRFLGDGTQWKQIAELNDIDEDNIFVGQALLIPQ